MAEGEIITYGTINNMTGGGKAAYARQIWDEEQQKFQSEINKETANDGLVSAKVAQTFSEEETLLARENIGALGSITKAEFDEIFND